MSSEQFWLIVALLLSTYFAFSGWWSWRRTRRFKRIAEEAAARNEALRDDMIYPPRCALTGEHVYLDGRCAWCRLPARIVWEDGVPEYQRGYEAGIAFARSAGFVPPDWGKRPKHTGDV